MVVQLRVTAALLCETNPVLTQLPSKTIVIVTAAKLSALGHVTPLAFKVAAAFIVNGPVPAIVIAAFKVTLPLTVSVVPL